MILLANNFDLSFNAHTEVQKVRAWLTKQSY